VASVSLASPKLQVNSRPIPGFWPLYRSTACVTLTVCVYLQFLHTFLSPGSSVMHPKVKH
jgi:hypothetical protein